MNRLPGAVACASLLLAACSGGGDPQQMRGADKAWRAVISAGACGLESEAPPKAEAKRAKSSAWRASAMPRPGSCPRTSSAPSTA